MNDKLKDLIKGISDLGVLVSDVSGGFSFSEVTELVAVVQDVSVLMKEAPALAAQYEALDEAARADLNAYVASLKSFPANAAVDVIIKKALAVAVALSSAIEELIK